MKFDQSLKLERCLNHLFSFLQIFVAARFASLNNSLTVEQQRMSLLFHRVHMINESVSSAKSSNIDRDEIIAYVVGDLGRDFCSSSIF